MTVEIAKPMVLLVEDEQMIAALVEEELQQAGFGVIYAPDGPEAETAIMSGLACEAVVLDINLPGSISGWELARIARSQCPNVAVVYASGHGELEWLSEGVPSSVIITKPYLPRDVVALLREQIEARSEPDNDRSSAPIRPHR